MSTSSSEKGIKPRIFIHGGAGNISRENLPPRAYEAYKASLLAVLQSSSRQLEIPGAKALDVATHAIALLEDDTLFNAGKGAVFTRTGTIELEASVMVSRGYRKRGVGCMLLTRVKNPIKLAREMLVRGEEEHGGGAYGHCQLSGPGLEELARSWGLEMCENSYFFTKRRWEQHRKGLENERSQSPLSSYSSTTIQGCRGLTNDEESWDGIEYLPQGTVGAVVLDSFGDMCVATSTGGLTNKLAGRIGDTPTLGAGFWAEEWQESKVQNHFQPDSLIQPQYRSIDRISRGDLVGIIAECFPTVFSRQDDRLLPAGTELRAGNKTGSSVRHSVAMSGTGNGDSFLRLNAVRTAAAISRFSTPNMSLAAAITKIVGLDGEMQKSAGDRWARTGEGEGGIIGIELLADNATFVSDFNCGGMFRAWIDDDGEQRLMVFRNEYY